MDVSTYIGVTGFMRKEEVLAALQALPEKPCRKLMVGVLVSAKTLAGQTNKYPQRYPKVEEISSIFVEDRRALNLIHYATDDAKTLCDQLIPLAKLGGDHLHGFQLNVCWPDPYELRRFVDKFPNLRIVLEVGTAAIQEVDATPRLLADKLDDEYKELATDILIDPSAGRGRPFDPETACRYLRAIQDADLDLGYGVAGGLGPDRLQSVKEVHDEFWHVSIDAEGGLRDAQDNLELSMMTDYLKQAHALFRAAL